MESENVSSNAEFTEEVEGKTAQKIRVSNHITGLQYTNRCDSFVVEIERFSHLTQKPNSGITRSQARKGSVKKTNHQNATNENSIIASSSSSPRAASLGASTPEKPMIVTAGAAADSPALQPFNQITVVTGGDIISSSPTERRFGDKKFGFRRPLPSPSWTLDPRRILLFFAALSSMGTILLIYFTLSIGTKLGGDETALN